MRCTALTKKKLQCSRNVKPNEQYCSLHLNQKLNLYRENIQKTINANVRNLKWCRKIDGFCCPKKLKLHATMNPRWLCMYCYSRSGYVRATCCGKDVAFDSYNCAKQQCPLCEMSCILQSRQKARERRATRNEYNLQVRKQELCKINEKIPKVLCELIISYLYPLEFSNKYGGAFLVHANAEMKKNLI